MESTLLISKLHVHHFARAIAVVIALAFACAAGTGRAEDADASPRPEAETKRKSMVKSECFADVTNIYPGITFRIACKLTIEKDWHVYWKDAGDSGEPLRMTITAPAGYEVLPIEWPRPTIFEEDDFTNPGYEGVVILSAPIRAPEDDEPATSSAEFNIDLRMLVCRGLEVCVMEKAAAKIKLPTLVITSEAPDDKARTKLLSELASEVARVPAPAEKLAGVQVETSAGRVVIQGPCKADAEIRWLPISWPGVTIGTPEIQQEEGRFKIVLPWEIVPENSMGQPPHVAGLVLFGQTRDDPAFEVLAPLQP